jgi:hypothetical protein
VEGSASGPQATRGRAGGERRVRVRMALACVKYPIEMEPPASAEHTLVHTHTRPHTHDTSLCGGVCTTPHAQ